MQTRILFTFLVLFILISACAAPATPPVVATPAPTDAPRKTGRIRYLDNANQDVRDVPMHMALDALGAQGYTVERLNFANAPLIVEALARGEGEIASANIQTMWTVIAKGAPARTIAQRFRSTLLVASNQEIKDCRQADGKRIGLPNAPGKNPTLFDLYIKKYCPDITPQLVILPETQARLAALLAGQVDAALMQGDEFLQIEKQAPAKFRVLMPLYQEFPQVQGNGLHVQRAWAEKNPEIVRDFLRALVAANRQVLAQPELLYAEAVKRIALEPATAQSSGEAALQLKVWDANLGLTAASAQATLDFLTNAGSLPKTLKLDDVADLSYLNAVLEEVGRK